MDILETGSAARRQLVDWMAFHVKQGFHPQWIAYQRLLKQRNALLKRYPNANALSHAARQELAAWDKGLASHAALITHYRQQVFAAWKPEFYALIAQLLPQYANNIRLRFSPGYDSKQPLEDMLQQRLVQDCQMGYTRIGCHRADVQILWQTDDEMNALSSFQQANNTTQSAQQQQIDLDEYDETVAANQHDFIHNSTETSRAIKEQAVNVLSRGEKKLLITALRLSQLPVLSQSSLNQLTSQAVNKTMSQENVNQLTKTVLNETLLDADIVPVVMLDDITAELDDKAVDVLLSTLSRIPCQLFITSLSEEVEQQINRYWKNYRLFHVKQGSVLSKSE